MLENIRNKFNQIKLTEIFDNLTKPKDIQQKPIFDNTKVLIEVLDKISNNEYKILVNGRLFVSNLPDNFVKGDILLAKVLRANPLNLSLVNILQFSELNDKNQLAILLQYLKLPIDDTSQALLRAFIKLKIPIVKNKFEQILSKLSDSGLIFDNEQLETILKLYIVSNKSGFKFDANLLKLFFDRDDELYSTFLGNLQKLINTVKDKNLLRIINEFLIYELDDLNQFNQVFDKTKIVLLLDELVKSNLYSEYSELLNILKFNLSRIILRNKYLKFINRHKDFLIVKSNNKLTLLKYSYEKVNPEQLDNVERLLIFFKLINIGNLETDLLLNSSNLYIKFIGNEEILKKIEETQENLISQVEKKYKISVKISLYNPEIMNG
jgi:hypothetical protein